MTEEDDEVVFENSALHHHLKSVGFEEDDVLPEKRSLLQELEDPDHQVVSESTIENNANKSVSIFSLNFLRQKLQTVRRQAEQSSGKVFYHSLLNNNALEAEDRSLLVNFVEDETLSGCTPADTWWIRPLSVLTLMTSYLIPRVGYPDIFLSMSFPVVVSDVAVSTLVAIGIGPDLVTYLTRKWYQQKCEEQVSAINQTVDCLKSLKGTCKKAIRLIQETELVTRGFTLVSHTASLPWLEKGSGSQRQCLELRKLVFNVCRSGLLLYRRTTLNLIQKHQVVGEMLEGGSYLAHIPLEEYGALVVGESEETVKNATDNYSIGAIKAMFQLHNWYMSETLKRLALGLLLQENNTPESSVISISADVMTAIYCDVQEHLKELQLCYKLHQCATMDNDAEVKQTSQKSHAANVYTAVHSLNLHLQAALRKVQDMEERLEPLFSEDNSSGHIASSQRKTISVEFAHLQTDLDSCKDCVEEGISRLEKKQYPPKSEQRSEDDELVPKEELEPTSEEAVPLLEIGDPIIEDQVFEAYTDPNEMEEDMYDPELMFSEEERERRRSERKNAKRVIRELNNRIAVKDWEREREKRRQAGEDLDEEEPPEQVAFEAEEEENDVQRKKNPYASVLSEYEKQWKEMDSLLEQEKTQGKGDTPNILQTMPSAFVTNDQSNDCNDQSNDITVNYHNDSSDRTSHTGEGLLLSSCTTENDFESTLSTNVSSGGADSTRERSSEMKDLKEESTTSQSHLGDQPNNECSSRGLGGGEHTRDLSKDSDSEHLSALKQKLQHLPGVGFGFSSNVAAIANLRSQQMGLVADTFGDSDNDEEISDET